MFHCQSFTARFFKHTQSGRCTNPCSQCYIEDLYKDLPNIVTYPFIKNSYQECSILLPSYRSCGYLVAFLKPRLIFALDDGDKLHKLRANLVAQKTVDLQWMPDVSAMQCGQDVKLDIVFFKQL